MSVPKSDEPIDFAAVAERRLTSLQHVTIALNELASAVNSIARGGRYGRNFTETEDALWDIEERLQAWDSAGPVLEAVHQYANKTRNADLINILARGLLKVRSSDEHTIGECNQGECGGDSSECFCWCHS